MKYKKKERQHDLFEWKNTPFYDTLKERVKEHFKGFLSFFMVLLVNLISLFQLLVFLTNVPPASG